MTIRIALVGDHDAAVTAHRAIPLAIQLTSTKLNLETEYKWIDTDKVNLDELKGFGGVWCVPASPYKSTEGALEVIKYARENNVPFLGTCGGYQHAVLEYARNVLGYKDAENMEENPNAEMPLISALECRLVEKKAPILIKENSSAYAFYKTNKIFEEYHCSFGVNPKYLSIFDNSDMKFTGEDESGEPRIIELRGHPFFIGTAFQPERWGLRNEVHPIVQGFINAVKINSERKPKEM
jgi:CTP synthase (UTP-ammonia lyase)